MARRLGAGERFRIEALVGVGRSAAEIARWLGRSRSTVCREIARNGGRCGYRAEAAEQAATVRARRPRASKLTRDPGLASAVAEGLAQRWSPHAIAESLRDAGPGVCAETIYRACYDQSGRSGLAADSWKQLPRQRRKRKPKSRCEQAKRSALGDYRPLAERPVEVDDRGAPGHWEGDLIIGRNNRTAIATLVERASRHTVLVALPGGYDAKSTARAVTAALGRQPAAMVKTLTWDQGPEMAPWADIENALDIEVYFCEARSPWQRATNEQTNGIIRRWLPKSTDLDINPVRLAIIEDHLNTMPRKLHNWRTAQTIYDKPQTIYDKHCRDHQ